MTLITKSLLWLYLVDPGVDSTIDKKINKRKKNPVVCVENQSNKIAVKIVFIILFLFTLQKNKINRKYLTEI